MDRLYVFGGGHVSLALCKIMQDLNFHISVLDDRNEDLLTLRNNIFADEKRIIQYENASSFIKEGYNNYVVIMTFGHKSDEVVLREVLHCDNK